MNNSVHSTEDRSPRRRCWRIGPCEFKVLALRECTVDDPLADTPQRIADFWRAHVETAQWYQPDRENAVVIMLNTRRRIIGFNLISIGTMDTILVHPREVFRLACIAAASAVVLGHNHPSGDPTPSDSDVRSTRDLFRAGLLMRIDVLDHIIFGRKSDSLTKDFCSLREMGLFYDSPPASPSSKTEPKRRAARKRRSREPAVAGKQS